MYPRRTVLNNGVYENFNIHLPKNSTEFCTACAQNKKNLREEPTRSRANLWHLTEWATVTKPDEQLIRFTISSSMYSH